jgi:hypothetical protein
MTQSPSDEFPVAEPTRRCLGCYYVLNHLPEPRCPECGRAFDPNDPTTYTHKPPFIWWRYWLPGFVLACCIALVMLALLLPMTGFGWAVTLALPAMIGGLVGFATRMGKSTSIILAWLVMIACIIGLFVGGAGGIFCALILVGMALVPLSVSVLLGVALRHSLRDSRWSQRYWLPVLFVLLPPAVALVEALVAPPADEVVETTVVIHASQSATWASIQFYEEVAHDPPWLVRLGLRRPVRAIGKVEVVGDRRKCIYTRGHLTKEVTAIRPGERLDFAVVEQEMFEDYSVRLTGGSFALQPIDSRNTRVTLTTRYRPLLRPRWGWQPVEAEVVHALHNHVLDGMAQEAARRVMAELPSTERRPIGDEVSP